MHIPDGYLSPSTCAALYAVSGSGWYVALRKVKRLLLTRTIPLISVMAAFSFVVMMFNIPLPGGTTAHATGIAISAIVLGPWGAILSTSIALAIQALFFGDGGITTLGANSFNMAIIGSLVAYGTWRALAGGENSGVQRKSFAAGLAGYLSINAAALAAAIEFGIQPALFHDAFGTPLYAPYPLRVAVPAMMLGHLTIAGLAEAILSAGMMAYILSTNSGLLRGTTAAAPVSSRRIWATIALLLLLTPLGTLAVGTAWGEWAPHDVASSAGLAQPPAGMQRVAQLWTAPFPAYAPAFIRNEKFGYMLSAMFGIGLIAAISVGASYVAAKSQGGEQAS